MAQGRTEKGSPSGQEAGAKAGGKAKPSYKHVPHSQKPPHLVAKRNARERRRVQAVNQAFYRLRKCVPIENRNKRVSKVKTLQRAIYYIRKLELMLAEDNEQNEGPSGGVVNQLAPSSSSSTPAATSTSTSTIRPTKERRARKQASININNNNRNCDQLNNQQQQATIGPDCNQSPQIIAHKQQQRRTSSRKAGSSESVVKPMQHQFSNADNCGQQLGGAAFGAPQVGTEEPLALHEAHKYDAEPYYTSLGNCSGGNAPASAYQQTQQEVLRESTAYNAGLNYIYADHNHHQNHHHGLHHNQNHLHHQQQQQEQAQQQHYHHYITEPTSVGQTFDAYHYSCPTGNSFYGAHIGPYSSPTESGLNAVVNVAQVSYQPAVESQQIGWQTKVASSQARIAAPITSLSETSGSSAAAAPESTTTTATTTPAASTLDSNGGGASNAITAAADSSTSACSTSSASFALLQSPCSSTNSSLDSFSSPTSSGSSSAALSASAVSSTSSSSSSSTLPATASGGDNSSTVVCRPLRSSNALSALSAANRQHQQQVNNSYQLYAANRMGARAAHLSFAVNSNTSNDNNAYQQCQQLNGRKATIVTANELDSAEHQVRQTAHLMSNVVLSSSNAHAAATPTAPPATVVGLSANNLHVCEQQQQYHQQHHHNSNHHHQQQQQLHQQSSFLNQQHTTTNLHHHTNLHQSHLSATLSMGVQQPTIQEYASLPL